MEQFYYIRMFVPEDNSTENSWRKSNNTTANFPPIDLREVILLAIKTNKTKGDTIKIIEVSPDGKFCKAKLNAKAPNSERRHILGLSTFGSNAAVLKTAAY